MEAALFLVGILGAWFGLTFVWCYTEATSKQQILKEIGTVIIWIVSGAFVIGITAPHGLIGLLGGHLLVLGMGLALLWRRVFG